MKQLTNYQRATNYLLKVFKAINHEYFEDSLETPTVTIQSTASAYGHVTVSKVWNNGEQATHELNISADYLNRPIEDVVATLIHEACHLFAMQNNIKDTSNNGVYHNKRFKALAEERGLIIERDDRYGWTITSPSEETIEFCIANGFEDIKIGRMSDWGFTFTGGTNGDSASGSDTPRRPKKPSSTRKYMCPHCGNSFRATKDLNVMCMDCGEIFEKVE